MGCRPVPRKLAGSCPHGSHWHGSHWHGQWERGVYRSDNVGTSGGPCHPTDHSSSHRPTSWPMRNIHGVGWGAGGYHGTNLLDYSIHWLSQRQRVIHLLDFPTCMEWLPTWELEILRDSHQGIFRVRAPPGHQTSIAPPPWLVTHAYQFLPHLGWLSLLWTIPRTIRPQPQWGTKCTGTG